MARKLDNKPGMTIWARAATGGLANTCRFVKWVSGIEEVAQCDTPGEAPLGVIQNSAKEGESLAVVLDGIVLIELGGTVANGTEVATDNVGRAVTAVEGDLVAGTLIKGGASGEISSLRLAERATRKTGGSIIAVGSAVLVAGTRTVTTTSVKTGDKIFISRLATGGTVGHLAVGTITDAMSFVIDSSLQNRQRPRSRGRS